MRQSKVRNSTSREGKVKLAESLGFSNTVAKELNGSKHTLLGNNIAIVKRGWIQAREEEQQYTKSTKERRKIS